MLREVVATASTGLPIELGEIVFEPPRPRAVIDRRGTPSNPVAQSHFSGADILRVVLLTAHRSNGEPQHRYVAHQIAAAFPQELSAIIVATGVQRSLPQRVARIARRYSFSQILSRIMLRAQHLLTGYRASRERRFNAIFFPEGGGETMPRPDLLYEVTAHNSAQCRALLDQLQPDVIMTYGTLIIRPDLIAKARVAMINMHTGLSPTYRGSDTIFWPLHNGEPEFVGVTIHRVDPGVDSGAILHLATVRHDAEDDEHSLFAKAVVTGTPLLIQAAREEYDGLSHPVTQRLDDGREYFSVERTVCAEWRVWRRLRNGLLRGAIRGVGGRADA